MLSFFGDFEFKSKSKISINDVSPSGIIPNSDSYFGEDLITGVIHDSKIEICEAKFTDFVSNKPVDFFNGLIISIDVCNSDIKLRGGFSGHTVLIADQHKEEAIIQNRFSQLNRVALPNTLLEQEFELFSNNEEEAKKILSAEFLEELKDLSSFLRNAKEQHEHIENKILYCVEQAILNLSGKVQSLFTSIVSKDDPNAHLHDPHEVYDPTKHNTISDEVSSINNYVQAAARKDKFIITIPYTHDLFEPNSLFSKPIIEEDKQILFRIMSLIDSATRNLVEVK